MCEKHPYDGPKDRSGRECRRCVYERQARRRERANLGLMILKQIEDSGIPISELGPETGFAIGLSYVAAKTEAEAQAIEREHPVLIQKFKRRMATA